MTGTLQKEFNKPSEKEHEEFLACLSFGMKERVLALLDLYPEAVNQKCSFGTIPLGSAAYYNKKEMVELLLERGALIDAQDNGGWTALMQAADNGNQEILEVLLSHGASIHPVNCMGKSALVLAEDKGHTKAIQLLKKSHAKWLKKTNCSDGLRNNLPVQQPLRLKPQALV
jgi:ankyrin repeat protein